MTKSILHGKQLSDSTKAWRNRKQRELLLVEKKINGSAFYIVRRPFFYSSLCAEAIIVAAEV